MEINTVKNYETTKPIQKIAPIEHIEFRKEEFQEKEEFQQKENILTKFLSKETSFSFDDETKELVIRVKLGDVLNQFPSDDYLRMKKWLISQKDDTI